MLMHKLDENLPGAFNPDAAFMAKFGTFMQEVTQAGVLLAAEGLRPSTVDAARITVTGGKATVTDGPFTETKELIAGFALVEVRDKEEALEWAKRFADIFAQTIGEVEVDVRRVTEMSDIMPPA
ncbi:YciI family protein [Micromonospora phytophila]|uniref:YciI family protein n=1 Tax=Micromonospora phytophila TaxID=709888 RepID=UPI00202FA8F0|nr:YciI family protein [Micromonospora phytophila]MCM0673264.1 YciI family protein [Micromonospora phytophila]